MRLYRLAGWIAFVFLISGFSLTASQAADQKLIGAAKKEGSVTLYHSLTRRVLKELVAGFEKKYGIKVNWTRKGTGGIIRMVAAEKLAGALRCDIVSTGDPTAFMTWRKQGILMQYVTPNTPAFRKNTVGPDGWYTPSRTTYMSIGISTKRVKKDEIPKSWKDLLDPKWKGRIAVIDPQKSGPSRWWLGAMVTKFGWGYFEKLAKNKPLMLKASSTAAVALISGEVDLLVIANEHDLIARAAKGQPVQAVYPSEGIVAKTSPVGICAKAPHPNAAKLWIDWETSLEVQKLMSKIGGYPPVRKDMEPYFARDPKVTDPDNMVSMDPEWFHKNKKKVMKKFAHIMSGKM